MSTASAEAVAMACCIVLFGGVTLIALRTQRRTGRRNQFVFIAPLVALVALGILIANLNGVVIAGG